MVFHSIQSLILVLGTLFAATHDTTVTPLENDVKHFPHPVSADVLIDVGHGGIDGGAVYGGVMEKDINLMVAQQFYRSLLNKGYKVILNRSGDYALSEENLWLVTPSRHRKDLAQRKHLALQIKPKVFISLHMNVSSRTSKRGPLVIYQANRISYEWAAIMQKHLNHLYGVKEVSRIGKSYYILKQDTCPAMIVEMGFLSNPEDRNWLLSEEGQRKMVQTLVNGVDEYFTLMY